MTLELRLVHDFPGFRLDVDVTLPGGLTCLFGRSGSGKTSLINAVAGLLRPDQARIVLDGVALHALPPHRREVGYVFQDARLFPHLTVAETWLTPPASAAAGPRGWAGSSTFWASAGSCRVVPARSRGAKGSGSRSAGHFCRSPGFC
jgi:ABC-type branched-subunit amino acid transport system ATPase component